MSGAWYIVNSFLTLADDLAPGLIEGFYAVGSLALNDYRPGKSDIDFVAVTAKPLSPGDWSKIKQAHALLSSECRRPWLSGVYVTWEHLASDPRTIHNAAFHHEGQFGIGEAFEANPAVWFVLRDHGVCFRGPQQPKVWRDDEGLRQWSFDNLHSYWRPWIERRRGIAGIGATLLSGHAIEWCVAGVARVHYAIAHAAVTSKTGALESALTYFTVQHRPVIQEALRIRMRRGEAGLNRLARRTLAIEFVTAAIEDATMLRLKQTNGHA